MRHSVELVGGPRDGQIVTVDHDGDIACDNPGIRFSLWCDDNWKEALEEIQKNSKIYVYHRESENLAVFRGNFLPGE
jgi:hypothetical protein